ncbi:MAG: phasin, PhaP, partial [Rhodobacterales bacterium 34-62-10]
MAKTQDFTTMMKDMMGAFPVDTKSMEDAFK